MSFFPGVTQVWTGRVELKRVTSARVSSFYFSSFDRFFFFPCRNFYKYSQLGVDRNHS